MKSKILKIFIFSIIALTNNSDGQQSGPSIDAQRLDATYVGLMTNLQSLLVNDGDLKAASKTKDQILKSLQPRLSNQQSHPGTQRKIVDLSCPQAYSNINRIEEAILHKLVENSANHNDKFEDISKNINCFGIKPEVIEEKSLKLKEYMNKCDNLITKIGDVREKLELHKEPKATLEKGYDDMAQILAEISEKLNGQEEKLEQWESVSSSIEKAKAYVAAKRRRLKCRKCLQQKIANAIKAGQNK